MNTLSLLMYLANVAPKFASGLLLFSKWLVAISIAWLLITAMRRDMQHSKVHELSYDKPSAALKKSLIWMGLVIALTSFIPNERTFYLIASSEIGEMVIKDEATKELLNEVKETILFKLKDARTEDKK